MPHREQKSRKTNRRVGSHILSHTSSISDLTVKLVLVHTVRGGRLTDVTGAASEHKLVGSAIFLGVEEVRAMHMLAI